MNEGSTIDICEIPDTSDVNAKKNVRQESDPVLGEDIELPKVIFTEDF